MNGTRCKSKVAIVALAAALAVPVHAAAAAALTEADREAVRAAYMAYGEAWLANDRERVMATLADDAVIMPAGLGPLATREAIEAFWWPEDGSSTTVTAYDSTVDEIDGGGDLAVVRGRTTMSFVYERADGQRADRVSRAMNLTVLERGEDGVWRITARMWGAVRGE